MGLAARVRIAVDRGLRRGAHKVWMARMYQPEQPNTCIISNGFAAMGIGVPGAIAAKLAFPERTVAAVTGDAGFMINSQEIETATAHRNPDRHRDLERQRLWIDQVASIAAVRPKRLRRFRQPRLREVCGEFRRQGVSGRPADEFMPILRQAIADNTVAVINCPVDYSENMKLTEQLGKMVCPV